MKIQTHFASEFIRLAASFTAVGLLGSFKASAIGESEALIDALGHQCEVEVMEKYDATDADVNVRLSASLRQDLDDGTMPAAELQAYGASFDWTVRGTGANGYCNVDGSGRITEFVQW
jgi:hypothetical protein